MTSQCPHCRSESGGSVKVPFILGIQLDVIHVEVLADGGSALELISTLCDYLTEGVQANAEQQQGWSITLVYAALDVHLCD